MSEYKCFSDHAECLVGGRVVAPRERIELNNDEVKANQRLIDEGVLRKVPGKQTASAEQAKSES